MPTREEILAAFDGAPKANTAQASSPKAADIYAAFEAEAPSREVKAPVVDPVQQVEEGLRGNLFTGALDTGLSIASSLAAEPVAGLAGLYSAATGGDATATIESVREGMTWDPKTQRGQENLEAIGGALAPVGEAITSASETLGDTAYDLTGSPVIAAAFYTVPDAAFEVLGLGLAGKGKRIADNAADLSRRTTAEKVLADPTARVNNPIAAQWTAGKDGSVVENTLGRQMTKEGIDAGDAALITNSNKATRTQMESMRQAANKRTVGDKSGNSPSQVIGVNAGRMVGQVNDQRKRLGKQMDEFVEGDMGKTPVSATPAINEFYSTLSEMGVKPKVNMNTGKVELDFRGSPLEAKTLAGARRLLSDGFDMTTGGGKNTLADIHKMKKNLDNLLDAKKLEQGGELGNVERKLLTLRSGLNDAARQVDGYAQLNDQYKSIADALSGFDKYRPAGMSWDNPKVANNLGAALKSASTDTAGLNNIIESLKMANNAMATTGGKAFDVDVQGLARFNDVLMNQYARALQEAQPKGGFMRKAGANVQAGALSAAVGNKFGMGNAAAGIAVNALDARSAAKAAADARKMQATIKQALVK